MGLALVSEHAPQRLLGRGLADRAGHRDHLPVQTRARGMRESNEAREHILHHEQRCLGCEPVALRGFDYRERGAGLQRRSDKIVSVVNVALDGEIGFARRNAAAVDRQPGNRFRQHPATCGLHRRSHRTRRP